MRTRFLLSFVMAGLLILPVTSSFAADQCKSDADCTGGNVCVLAADPHVCKAPQPTGASCKRDAVCASKTCEIPSGKDVGVCK